MFTTASLPNMKLVDIGISHLFGHLAVSQKRLCRQMFHESPPRGRLSYLAVFHVKQLSSTFLVAAFYSFRNDDHRFIGFSSSSSSCGSWSGGYRCDKRFFYRIRPSQIITPSSEILIEKEFLTKYKSTHDANAGRYPYWDLGCPVLVNSADDRMVVIFFRHWDVRCRRKERVFWAPKNGEPHRLKGGASFAAFRRSQQSMFNVGQTQGRCRDPNGTIRKKRWWECRFHNSLLQIMEDFALRETPSHIDKSGRGRRFHEYGYTLTNNAMSLRFLPRLDIQNESTNTFDVVVCVYAEERWAKDRRYQDHSSLGCSSE